MAGAKRKAILQLPLRLIFTDNGINFFMNHGKKLNKFVMADNVSKYGIFLAQFSPPSVQRMMLTDYIYQIEISRVEFISRRSEIMDLSKLIVYGFLYHQFDEVIFEKVVESDLIMNWNRSNPGNSIDRNTRFKDDYLKKILAQNEAKINDVKREILQPILMRVRQDKELLPEEKNIQMFLAEKYLNNLRPLTWFVLSRLSDDLSYKELIREIQINLKQYMEKSRIAEYLSLMIMELAINAENTNLRNYYQRKYNGGKVSNEVIYDQEIRKRVIASMEKDKELIYLSWELGGHSSSIGTQNRLKVTLYNRQSEFMNVKKQVEDTKDVDLKKRSLMDFYQTSDTPGDNDLGMYYLSYLSDECHKVNIRFDSLVSQIRGSDLTMITLNLKF